MGWKKRREAIGALVQLWEWCVVHHEDGLLEGIEPADITFALDFTVEEAAQFLQALKECRLLDEHPTRLHDWWDYVGAYIETKYHNTNPARISEIARIYGKENLRMCKGYPEGASKEGLISPSSSALTLPRSVDRFWRVF